MENEQMFTYRYSAPQSREVERIRQKYLPQKENRMDTLRRLDNRVQTAGMVQALTLGIIGCLIFGVGMCFGLDILAGAEWITLLLCAIGVAVMLPAYPLWRHVAKKTRERLTPEILRLSDEIINP
ncbi:MAG: hypothetical protein IJW29_09275 [Clostridia bacterium]|nr:hypothetical protein [Clostridia bacterium]MBQ9785681.1 hypothetical protein [Clostridia bacterium]